jgi:hypothetical protein
MGGGGALSIDVGKYHIVNIFYSAHAIVFKMFCMNNYLNNVFDRGDLIN